MAAQLSFKGTPTVIASLTSLQAISCSHQQPSLRDCSLIPTVQLPATARTEGPVSWTGRAVVLCSIQKVTDQLIHSPTASNASSLSQTIALVWESHPCFSSFTFSVQVQSHSILFFPSFLHPIEYCMGLYISFWWSGTPTSSRLVLCEILCI